MGNMGSMSARDRILALVDENSFVEVGAMVTKRNTDFNLQEKAVPGDGVVTGYGLVDDAPVYVYAQDASALGGSIGEMHARKIVSLYDLALKVGAPVIGLIDCSGMRLQEATDALAGFGEVYKRQTMASGVIPQISAIFGTCGGGMAVSASLADFTVMEKNGGKFFVNAPNALLGNHVSKCDTASAEYQAKNGAVDFVLDGEAAVLEQVRSLVNAIGNNVLLEESDEDLNRLVPSFAAEVADPAKALADVADKGEFIEVKREYAQDVVVGFLALDGVTVGAVANRTSLTDDAGKGVAKFDAKMTTAGCYKAAEFVRFCSDFDIPVLTLTNTSGFAATMEEEKGVALAAAKLTAAFAEADVPRVNVVVGKAFGTAYVAMNSKHIGADMVFALPTAEIGMMEPDLAAKAMYGDEDESARETATEEYAKLQASPEAAAARGYVDSIIEGESVRKHLVYAFGMLA